MVINLSTIGLWRIGSTIAAMRYGKGERLKFLKGMITDSPRTEYTLNTPDGKFLCPDVASAYQFDPSWELGVKMQIAELHDGLFLDIGANIGFYSVMAGKQGNYVIAVEPNPDAFTCLSRNLLVNLGHWFTCWPVAAWDHTTIMKLRCNKNTDISKVSEIEGEPVPAYSIDDLLGGKKPNVIKIDVEGSELKVLQGMQKTLENRPTIIFEALNKERLWNCESLLKSKGYSVLPIDRTNHIALG